MEFKLGGGLKFLPLLLKRFNQLIQQSAETFYVNLKSLS
jgi:hypothetical protein